MVSLLFFFLGFKKYNLKKEEKLSRKKEEKK